MFGLRTPTKQRPANKIPQKDREAEIDMLGYKEDLANQTFFVNLDSSQEEQFNSETVSKPPKSRVMEAKQCVNKAKSNLDKSKNTKTEIKTAVYAAIDRLYELVKEGEDVDTEQTNYGNRDAEDRKISEIMDKPAKAKEIRDIEFMRKLDEQAKLINENNLNMKILKETIDKHQAFQEKQSHVTQVDSVSNLQPMTYADMARKPVPQTRNHALIISSPSEADTSTSILEKIRGAVDARTTGIRVDMVRKARDQKVVIGCRSNDEMQKLRSRLQKEAKGLKIEEAKAKDPYVIIRDVLSFNTNEEVETSLRTQNHHVLGDVPETEYRAVVKYRRRARNPLESHIIMQVSPQVWQRITAVGVIHIDLQRRPVFDQSPLLQCTKCLGFGHGRRLCKEATDICSHCGGQHLRRDCPVWKDGNAPTCRNCKMAKNDRAEHSAYDMQCPTRRRWDLLARSSVAYC